MKNFQTRNLFLLALIVVIASGCAMMNNLEELLRLKSYSDEKDRQQAFVKAQDREFKKILAAAKAGFRPLSRPKKDFKEFWTAGLFPLGHAGRSSHGSMAVSPHH